MNSLEFYEHKVISDPEFPMQIFENHGEKKGEYFNPHWHEHIEMHYVLEGHTLITVNQKEIRAEKGDLVIANSNEMHRGYCDGTHFRTLCVIFELGAFSQEIANQNIIMENVVRQDERIRELMYCIYQETNEEKMGYRLMCKGAIYELIVYLMRSYAVEALTDQESSKRLKRLERLNTALSYIREHYMEPISNKELADVVNLSEDRFNHLFKESMGVAPQQYVNEIRLKKAMNLLKKKEGNVAEVAYSVGYTDYNHFGRQFRKMFGCPPSKILNQ